MNETIYQDMGPAQRARTHHLIAQALDVHQGDSTGPHVLEVAAHWSRAVPAAPVTIAVEHALEAASWGANHVAHQEAVEQLHVALGLIADLPDGRPGDVLELRVHVQLSMLLKPSTSSANPTSGWCPTASARLSVRVDDHALLAPALWRLSVHYFIRCDVRAGLEVSNQLLDLPPGDDPGPARVAGHIAFGLVNHVRGDQIEARRHFEQAVTLCDAGHDAGLAPFRCRVTRRHGPDVRRRLAPRRRGPEREADGAFARAAELGLDSWATMVSLWGASTVSMLRRDAVTTLQRCDDGIALAKAGGYGLGIPYMTVNRGWAIAVPGDAAEGEAQIIEGTLMAEAFDAEYLRWFFRAVRAEACLLAGRHEDAHAAVDDGLSIIEANGDIASKPSSTGFAGSTRPRARDGGGHRRSTEGDLHRHGARRAWAHPPRRCQPVPASGQTAQSRSPAITISVTPIAWSTPRDRCTNRIRCNITHRTLDKSSCQARSSLTCGRLTSSRIQRRLSSRSIQCAPDCSPSCARSRRQLRRSPLVSGSLGRR